MPTAQGPTVWFWVGAAAAGGDEVLSAACYGPSGWYVQQVDQDDGELQAFWSGTLNDSTTTLDDFVAFLVGPPASDDVQATQDYNDDYHPHAVIIQIDDDYWGNVWGFPDQALDVVAQLFPPAAVEPIETFAAQPHYGDDFATYVPTETDDYQRPPEQNEPFAPPEIVVPELASVIELREQPWFPDQETEDYDHAGEPNEFLAPPEIVVPELLAAIELREQPWFGDQETEDYQADTTLDVPHLYPATPAEPIETFAAQPLSEQAWFDGEVLEDYGTLPEQLEPFAPPEAVVPELLAAQPYYGEAFWPDLDTEDYQQDSSLDVSPQFFQIAQEPDSTFAAQPHYGEWFWEAQETEDYAGLPLQNGFLSGTVPDEELIAATQILEQPWFEATETEDYGYDLLGIEAFIQAPLTAAEFSAASDLPDQQDLWPELWPFFDPWDDGIAVLFPPPLFPGLPVDNPQAGLGGDEAQADETTVGGQGALLGGEGMADETAGQGEATLTGNEGRA